MNQEDETVESSEIELQTDRDQSFEKIDVSPSSNSDQRDQSFEQINGGQELKPEEKKLRAPSEPRGTLKEFSILFQNQRHSQLGVDLNHQRYENFDDVQKRKENRLIFMQRWEDKRVQLSSFFTRIVERLNTTLIKKANDSVQNFAQIIQFFRFRVQGDIKYAQTRLALLTTLYSSGDQKSIVYKNLNKALQQFELSQNQLQQQLLQSAQSVEKDVIQNILLKSQREFEQQVLSYGSLTAQLKKQYSTIYTNSLAKYRLFSQLFNETMKIYQKQNFKESEVKDLTISELDYFSCVETHYSNLKDFGKESIKFYKNMMQCEQDRIQCIKQAFQIYNDKLKQIYVLVGIDKLDEEMTCDFDSILNTEETQGAFELGQLLEAQEIHFINMIYGTSNLTLELFIKFLEDFKLNQIVDRPLVVKDIKAQHERIQLDGSESKWVDCSVLLTLDKTILITEGHDSFFKTPFVRIPMQQGCCEIDIDNRLLILNESQSIFLCLSKRKSHRIRAEYQHELEQFDKLVKENLKTKGQH